MSRPTRLRHAVLLVVLFFAAAALGGDRPNVLFIAIDDLRPELGCYGSPVAVTPNLDKLAGQGLLFERAYCSSPICGSSRASMLTGMYPIQNKRFEAMSPVDRDVPDAVTLPQRFKQAGYTTLSNGKIFHTPEDTAQRSWSEPAWKPQASAMQALDPETMANPSKIGRGYIVEHPDVPYNAYFDGMVADKTIADLRRLKDAGEPFFLACGFIRPHLPFYAPQKYWDLYDRDTLPLAENRYTPRDAPKELTGSREWSRYDLGELTYNSDAWHRELLHGYLASTSYADALAGQVIDALDEMGLADNTIVVVWGDHGWHLGGHNFWGKHNTLHDAIRIPLLIRLPTTESNADTKGQRTAAMVESVDLYPTLCELAGLDTPAAVQGRSFVPLFRNPQDTFRSSIYCRFGPGETVVTPDFAYTRYNGVDGPRMLFDHTKDPAENMNVAADPAYGDVVNEMNRLLDQRMEEARSNQ